MMPEGWLIEPAKKWLLLFRKDPISLQRSPKIYMDKWYVTNMGTPAAFRDRRKVDFEPALETWNELMGNGWKRVDFIHDSIV